MAQRKAKEASGGNYRHEMVFWKVCRLTWEDVWVEGFEKKRHPWGNSKELWSLFFCFFFPFHRRGEVTNFGWFPGECSMEVSYQLLCGSFDSGSACGRLELGCSCILLSFFKKNVFSIVKKVFCCEKGVIFLGLWQIAKDHAGSAFYQEIKKCSDRLSCTTFIFSWA